MQMSTLPIIKTLLALVSLALLIHLAYAISNSGRRKLAISKRKKEMPAYARIFDKSGSGGYHPAYGGTIGHGA